MRNPSRRSGAADSAGARRCMRPLSRFTSTRPPASAARRLACCPLFERQISPARDELVNSSLIPLAENGHEPSSRGCRLMSESRDLSVGHTSGDPSPRAPSRELVLVAGSSASQICARAASAPVAGQALFVSIRLGRRGGGCRRGCRGGGAGLGGSAAGQHPGRARERNRVPGPDGQIAEGASRRHRRRQIA